MDLTIVNAWLLYKQSIAQKSPHVKPLRLYDIKAEVAEGLCKEQKKLECGVQSAKRRKMDGGRTQPTAKPHSAAVKMPTADVQHDGVGHYLVSYNSTMTWRSSFKAKNCFLKHFAYLYI